MPNFLPKTVYSRPEYPACVDLKELFENDKFAPSVNRTIAYLSRIHAGYGSPVQYGVITERFYLEMPTVDALISEIELMNAIWAHALGNIDDANIKVYIQKYLDTHIFVYQENSYEIKSGASRYTGRDIDLYLFTFLPRRFGSGFVLNAIQTWLLTKIEAKSGNNAKYSINKL